MSELLSVGCLGLGNGGGNVADLAAGNGFLAVAVNGSTEDLDRLQNNVTKFPVGDGKGTGKDRNKAKDFLTAHIGIIDDAKMQEFLGKTDIVFLVTSTGGGFGSGASIMMAQKILEKYPDKAIVPVGIFPFDTEGYTAQEHSVEWMKELKESGDFAYMYYDNNRFSHLTPKECCDRINEEILEAMKIFRGDYIQEDHTGGIDQRDMITNASIPGRIVAFRSVLEEADIIDNSLVKTVLEDIREKSGNAELAEDHQITASAVQYSLHPQFQKYVPGIKSDMQTMAGSHLNDYSNYHDAEYDEDREDYVAIVMAGLSDPVLRIDRMINRRDKMAEEILTRRAATSKLDNASVGDNRLRIGSKSFASGVVPKKVPVPNTGAQGKQQKQ